MCFVFFCTTDKSLLLAELFRIEREAATHTVSFGTAVLGTITSAPQRRSSSNARTEKTSFHQLHGPSLSYLSHAGFAVMNGRKEFDNQRHEKFFRRQHK